MAAHRFWRVGFFNSAGSQNSDLKLAEFAMRATISGANLITSGAMLTTDAGLTGGGPLSTLIDGNATTFVNWNDGALKQKNLIVDLGGSPADVVELYFLAPATGSGAQVFRYGILEFSDDNVSWKTLQPAFSMAPVAANNGTMVVSGFSDITPSSRRVLSTTAPRLGTSWPSGPLVHRLPFRFSRVNDSSGRYFIEGTTKIDDTPDIPVSRLVRLFRRDNGVLVSEQWSEFGTGAYRFENLKNMRYFVLAHDHTLYYNAVIKDEITPEAMV